MKKRDLLQISGSTLNTTMPSPTPARQGLHYEGQARFHPLKYLARLAELIHRDGSFIFGRTECKEITAHPLVVRSAVHTISTKYVVIATHTPLMGKTNTASATLLQTRLYLYTSYVIGGRLPRGTAVEGLFWDTADPYHYVRVDAAGDQDYVDRWR